MQRPPKPPHDPRLKDPKKTFGTDAAQFGGEPPKIVLHAATPPTTFLATCFALAIFGVPIGQTVYEKARGEKVQALDYLDPLVHGPSRCHRPASEAATHWWERAWRKLSPPHPDHFELHSRAQKAEDLALDVASAPRLRAFETTLHQSSFLEHTVQPCYQQFLTSCFGYGNARVFVGGDGWLFYADDLASVYGRGYLEPGMGGRAALDAIADFKKQLDERDPPVQLLLIPSFSKEMVEPEQLGRATAGLTSAANPDLEKLYAEFDRRGWQYVRMQPLFDECRRAHGGCDTKLAMPRDTHWTPQTMAFCAEKIAERALAMLGEKRMQKPVYTTRKQTVEAGGDLRRMLGLPSSQSLYAPMHLEIEQVVDAVSGDLERPDPYSEVLLMGDSLTKIFSDPSLGAGECAGLAEHLSLNMDQPIDVIALAGLSATATREALARRPGGLDDKKQLVIWQFGVRMLENAGEWKLVPLPESTHGFVPPSDVPKEQVTVDAELVEILDLPPNYIYDFFVAVDKYRVIRVVEGKLDRSEIYVATPLILKNHDTPARTWKPGLRQRLVLDDFRLHYNPETTSAHPVAGGEREPWLFSVKPPEPIR